METMKKARTSARSAGRRTGGRASEASGPDVLSLLHEDHEKVKGLFAQALEDKTSSASRTKLATQIVEELTLHAKLEETLFYPELRSASKRDTEERENVLEAYEEHAAMKDAIKRLQRGKASPEEHKAKIQVLCDLVEHHVQEEEGELFPEARSLLGENELRTIGAKVAEAKTKAQPGSRRSSSSRRKVSSDGATSSRRKK
ncbi:MAG: hemerythrin domain-containing protein [Candidatus Eremiobacteraeota bacterium]|nr:hemerythrin domain-containing protein [Candidatus Eremiobacteraeota bacterium]